MLGDEGLNGSKRENMVIQKRKILIGKIVRKGQRMKQLDDFKPLQLLNEGKTKKVYQTNKDEKLLLEFKDDLTAGNGEKHDIMEGKGKSNARVSSRLMQYLEENGVKTHFLGFVKPRHNLVKKLDMIPLECVGRNYAYGSLLRRVPLFEEGDRITPPVVEFFYKSDELGDPFMNVSHINALDILSLDDAKKIQTITAKVGKLLRDFFDKRGLLLVDFKIEFGHDANGELYIGDEINADAIRLWDKKAWEQQGEIRMFDKQVYREGESLEEVKNVYEALEKKVYEDK